MLPLTIIKESKPFSDFPSVDQLLFSFHSDMVLLFYNPHRMNDSVAKSTNQKSDAVKQRIL